MENVRRAVQTARLRLAANRFLYGLIQSSLVLSIGILIAIAVIRLGAFPVHPFAPLWALLAAIPWALFVVLRSGINSTSASIAVDDRFGLQERLSSALALSSRRDPMVELLKLDANRHAETLAVHSRFPIRTPRSTPYLGVILALCVGAALWLPAIPNQTLAPEQAVAKEQPVSETKKEDIKKILEQREKLKAADLPKGGTGTFQVDDPVSELAEKLKNEKLSEKQAMAALSQGEKQLREQKEKLERIEEARSRLSKKADESRYTEGVREALTQGDYAKAAENMKQMAEQLGKSEMSAAEMGQLEKELDNLAKALQGNPELQSALQQAMQSLKSAQSGDPSQSGESKSALTAEQKAQIQSALAKAAENLSDLQKLANNKSAMEKSLSDVDLAKLALSDALSQCQSCGKVGSSTQCSACKGGGKGEGGGSGQGKALTAGASPGEPGSGQGAGMGGPGQGRGNTANPYEEENVQFQDENVTSRWHQGRILGMVEVEGEGGPAFSVVGESAAFIQAGGQEEAVVQEEVPPGYEEIVTNYFGRE